MYAYTYILYNIPKLDLNGCIINTYRTYITDPTRGTLSTVPRTIYWSMTRRWLLLYLCMGRYCHTHYIANIMLSYTKRPVDIILFLSTAADYYIIIIVRYIYIHTILTCVGRRGSPPSHKSSRLTGFLFLFAF